MAGIEKAKRIGSVGRAVAANVRHLRTAQGISTARLSKMLGEHGRPIQATGITRIEGLYRAVDADDLVALADIFGVSPAEMLTPFRCKACNGEPPAGFSCRICGADG